MIFFVGLLSLTDQIIAQKTNPPGTIWLRDNIYIDAAPLANIHYREYEHTMRSFYNFNLDSIVKNAASAPFFGNDHRNFLDNMHPVPNPDSSRYKINQDAAVSWDHWVSFREYLNNSSYNFYPLVNISYDLAIEFCKWRTAMVQLSYSNNFPIEERYKFHKKIKYRLATSEEWEFAVKKFSNSKNLYIRKAKHKEIVAKLREITSCFTLTNLSEMVSEKNIVKGCNWKQKDCKQELNVTFESKSPADWITFRCVCEVVD